MTGNPIYVALASLHPDWNEEQRRDNHLLSQESALEHLIREYLKSPQNDV
jgi:hypothetical protein